MQPGEPAKWRRKDNLPEVTRSFQQYMAGEVLRDFAASTLQVNNNNNNNILFKTPYKYMVHIIDKLKTKVKTTA